MNCTEFFLSGNPLTFIHFHYSSELVINILGSLLEIPRCLHEFDANSPWVYYNTSEEEIVHASVHASQKINVSSSVHVAMC